MNNKEEDYILFIFTSKETGKMVANSVLPKLMVINNNKYLKFIYGDYGIVCHFSTKEEYNSIESYIYTLFKDYQYFLLEITDKMSVNVDDELKGELFDLKYSAHEKNSDDFEFDDGLIEKLKEQGENILDELTKMFIDEISSIDNNIEKAIKSNKPTLNDLLDKIANEGMEALTKQELKILNEYAKER